MKTYRIAYQNKSPEIASSLAQAKRHVRLHLRARRLYYADCPDGLYCYDSREAFGRDQTGAHADAVIVRPGDHKEPE
jgi:hypothetical protein